MRRHIIMEAAQSLGVLSSSAAFVLSCAWLVGVGAGALPLALAVFSPIAALASFVYVIVFDGQAIRERLLRKYEEGARKKKSLALSKTTLQKPYDKFVAQAARIESSLSRATDAKRAMLADSLHDVSHQVEKIVSEFCDGDIEDEKDVVGFIRDATATLNHVEACLAEDDPVKKARLELDDARQRAERAKRALENVNERVNANSTETE